ncbi:MAG: hypothetical protein MZW92_21055 [Comamonadaceae bacterium]|nr:hypothetical protein [Comamonadaceae bacterium]
MTTFQKLAAAQPRSPAAPMGQAEAHLGLKNEAAAERSLKAALELAPGLEPAQRGLARLYVGSGRHDEAIALARADAEAAPRRSRRLSAGGRHRAGAAPARRGADRAAQRGEQGAGAGVGDRAARRAARRRAERRGRSLRRRLGEARTPTTSRSASTAATWRPRRATGRRPRRATARCCSASPATRWR